jgi:ketosteroid isomerase-like protein
MLPPLAVKICPACRTAYTDDTLRFCLQDGSPLGPAADTASPTVAFNEFETVSSVSAGTEQPSAETEWRKSEVTRIAGTAQKPSRPARGLIWGLFAVVALLLFGLASLLVWSVLKNDTGAGNTNAAGTITANANTAGDAGGIFASPSQETPQPTPTTRPDTSPSPTPGSTPPTDTERIMREVSDTIYRWKERLEARDLNGTMSYYAATVNYYRRANATKAFVRNNKNTALSRFSSISISISDLSVSVAATGQTAIAEFDKEWVFIGARRSTGKVRSRLSFRNDDGRWLITGERDLKVYRSN